MKQSGKLMNEWLSLQRRSLAENRNLWRHSRSVMRLGDSASLFLSSPNGLDPRAIEFLFSFASPSKTRFSSRKEEFQNVLQKILFFFFLLISRYIKAGFSWSATNVSWLIRLLATQFVGHRIHCNVIEKFDFASNGSKTRRRLSQPNNYSFSLRWFYSISIQLKITLKTPLKIPIQFMFLP